MRFQAVLLVIAIGLFTSPSFAFSSQQKINSAGLESVPCWFENSGKRNKNTLPNTECYFMSVPESHDAPNGKHIRFPVLVFRSQNPNPEAPPVLHLD